MTQIWYSLRLSEEDYQLVIRTLKELILASSLEELTNGAMKKIGLQRLGADALVEIPKMRLEFLST